jgi:hypothetical protein
MKINTLEAAKLLGIKPTQLRLLMRKGKIKAPPIVFDSKTNSIGRMWSEDHIEQARIGEDLRIDWCAGLTAGITAL